MAGQGVWPGKGCTLLNDSAIAGVDCSPTLAQRISGPGRLGSQSTYQVHDKEYAIVTSHDFCLVLGANGLNALEDRGVRDDKGTIRQRLNRAVRKGRECSKVRRCQTLLC